MDALVLGRCVLLKSAQPAVSEQQRQAYLADFALD
jgi:hypothetical protein